MYMITIKKGLISLLFISLLIPGGVLKATVDAYEQNVSNVVLITCGWKIGEDYYSISAGTGVAISESLVVTAAHVVQTSYGADYDWCVGGIAANSSATPEVDFLLINSASRLDDYFDYAIMDVYDSSLNEYEFSSYATLANADSMTLGESVHLMGYPGALGDTITFTQGSISGFQGHNWIKSDAIAEFGNSGGAAFDSLGNLFGIPTNVMTGELNSFTYIMNINSILEDAFGTDIAKRDHSKLYKSENVFCFLEYCYQYSVDETEMLEGFSDSGTDENVGTPNENTLTHLQDNSNEQLETFSGERDYNPNVHDLALMKRLNGWIVLQVEERGEAWYINPDDDKRYYMRDGATAYQMMRIMSLGISDNNLEQIPMVNNVNEMMEKQSICSQNPLAKRLRGKILLQTEQHGEAWYVHPEKCYRIYMKDGIAAYDIMRFLSLGITNENVKKIPIGLLD